MNTAKPVRDVEVTQGLATAYPAELDQTQFHQNTPLPGPHGAAADSTQVFAPPDPSATTGFSADHAAAPIPPQLDPTTGLRYRVVRAHARGGLGQVSVAEDLELHREVAFKEILLRHAANPESRARFVMEAEITGGLEHPGIVPVYGLGTYPDGRPYYAMRFIRGESLADTIDEFHASAGKRKPGETAVALRQLISRFIAVCNAIEYAHSRGILHRDIKPANIMLGKYGETLVVDWGIAKVLGETEAVPVVEEGTLRPVSAHDTTATAMGSTVGTPQYMSPEQASGRLDLLAPASDVYSLGATLYYLILGKPAFEGNRIFEMLKNVERGEFPAPREVNKNIPKPLNAICLKAMALEPADRYHSAHALADDLERWLADEPVVAYRENRVERTRRWLRQHRSLAQASLVTLFGLTAVSIVAVLLINEARRLEVAAHEESERQRKLADESFQHARKAVDDFFTQVSENVLQTVPGMQAVRENLLSRAMAYEQQFLEQRGNDPTLRRETAAATYRVALVTGELKTSAEALPLFEKARVIQEELLAANPADKDLRYFLSNTYNEIGRQLFKLGRLEEVRAPWQKAREHRLWLVDHHPGNSEYDRKLASILGNLGVIASRLGHLDEARTFYQEGMKTRQRLVASNPGNPDYRRDLALGRYNFGLLLQARDPKESVQLLHDAVRDYEKLKSDHPLVLDYAKSVTRCYRLIGDIHIAQREFTSAIDAFEQALQTQRPLALQNPDVIEYAGELAAIYSKLGEVYERRGEPANSLPLVQQAVEVLKSLIQKYPAATVYRSDLAANITRMGTLEMSFGNLDAALESMLAAQQDYAELTAADPHNALLKLGQSGCLSNLGLVQLRLGKLEEARSPLEQALRSSFELLEQYPADASLLLKLSYTNLSMASQMTGRTAPWPLLASPR